ncbi:hypothetical protein PO903_13300 [Paenibacillus sp. PK4536]|jgi:hypothetical protein|uniref:Uncharacterized protein n=3 Tax=Paenibacillus TaxID=44249 RepID=A0A1E3L5G2_9BACL|nr:MULTISPECIES: hypothetical protein [Paenibacillus]MDN4616717.1 hypothetical protein [Paenibacillus sp. PsM32]MDQ1233500.1 hypothetical protein [Paenibacillus sp. SORGH_AS_0306]MDR6110541.1 hypothetical protein [Paenibacillus sp. SORGH_AS_0338]ODP28200.1 hypothetical protein PTI45_02401 [Paenibacillus nuruki]TKJ92350.1 hypothetical protein PaeCFBP13512_08680 [Paenibacillus sp. CFBP13512]
MGKEPITEEFFIKKLADAKIHFERALDCKHTEFDDLYPYMIEHPQFFWYKRYVAWSELLTIVGLCKDLDFAWEQEFSAHQVEYVEQRVMSAKVLDFWFEKNDTKEPAQR